MRCPDLDQQELQYAIKIFCLAEDEHCKSYPNNCLLNFNYYLSNGNLNM